MNFSVIQVLPTNDYKVYLYFSSGEVRLFDAAFLLDKGVFTALKDKKLFMDSCTVLNNTLAWDIAGNYDPYKCLDLDPETLYEDSIKTDDPLAKYA